VDAPLPAPDALIRPWRTATLVASLVAAIELVLLLVAGTLLLAKPLSRAMRHHAEAAALAPAKKAAKKVHIAKQPVVTLPRLTRDQTKVFVLNGNGRSGAAASEAGKLQSLGYRVSATGNAARTDYATTVVMYKRGYISDAHRLARDMHIKVVGPLDGLKPLAMKGAQLAIVLGAR
jgi:hypothetical protein